MGNAVQKTGFAFTFGIDFENMEYSVWNYKDFIPEEYKLLYHAYFDVVLICDIYAKITIMFENVVWNIKNRINSKDKKI